jgi:hypothetical protein
MPTLEQELNAADAKLGDGDTDGMLARVIERLASVEAKVPGRSQASRIGMRSSAPLGTAPRLRCRFQRQTLEDWPCAHVRGQEPGTRGSPNAGVCPAGYQTAEGQTDADMGRRHAEVFFDLLRGESFAQPNPRPMFPNPPGLLRLEPHSDGLRERIWWGAGSNATAIWAGQQNAG